MMVASHHHFTFHLSLDSLLIHKHWLSLALALAHCLIKWGRVVPNERIEYQIFLKCFTRLALRRVKNKTLVEWVNNATLIQFDNAFAFKCLLHSSLLLLVCITNEMLSIGLRIRSFSKCSEHYLEHYLPLFGQRLQ